MFDISLCWSISINTTCAIRIAIERPEFSINVAFHTYQLFVTDGPLVATCVKNALPWQPLRCSNKCHIVRHGLFDI